MFKKLLLFFTFIPVFLANAQAPKQVAQHQHAWMTLILNPRVSDKWGYVVEGHFRRSEIGMQPQQEMLRAGVLYFLDDESSFASGYAIVKTHPYGEQPVKFPFMEHRTWQHFITNSKLHRLLISHRYMLEQRWSEILIEDDLGRLSRDSFIYRNRIRYRILGQIALNTPKIQKGSFILFAFNEAFVNFGIKGLNVFDQNRAYAGLGYRFSQNSTIHLGYLNQYIFKSDGIRSENNHTLQVMFTHNFSVRNWGN
jgi:hypothetical protein